jgi:protein TonB
MPRTAESAAVAERPKTAEPAAIAAAAEPIALPRVETQAQSATSVPVRESAVTVAVESGAVSPKTIAGTGASANSDSSGAGRDSGAGGRRAGSGSGFGSGMGSGLGSGTGTGNGPGKGNGELPSVNASYNTCPRPETPEIARKNRWEGTTKLRVLVDEKGRPAIVEMFESSGFPILDQAAIDNIKQRCLFHPAREGEKAVKSWIRIPVIFPLAANYK